MVRLKKIALIVLVTVFVIAAFLTQYNNLMEEFEMTAKEKEAQVKRYIELSRGFIDLVTIYGNEYFEFKNAKDTNLYEQLQYDSSSNTYNLDAIEGTKYQGLSGNLSGVGKIPDEGTLRQEINLALHLNKEFCSIYNKVPEVAWVYYTSTNNFINIYPWVSSQDFSFSGALQAEKFFTYVQPENDPLRRALWTPVYLDHAGKGLMVTLSSPIYDGDTFMGAVSLDFTNNQLSKIISSPYETYIVDNTDSVMATTRDITFAADVIKLNSFLPMSESAFQKMKEAADATVVHIGGFFVYKVSFTDAPWTMYFQVSVVSVIGKAVLYTLPMLLICLLLFFTVQEVEKRKTTEVQLKKSLDELTSYQKMLENAAKYDFLTATVNRRGLIDIFAKNIGVVEKQNKQVVFVIGDIDYFKQINDQYGHPAGDKVLKEIAAIMQKNVTGDDIVCRWGGEEFVIMLVGKKFDDAMLIAETIRKEIESHVIYWENSQELRITITFGVARYTMGDSIDASIAKADAAMYTGKKRGRNQVVGNFFHTEEGMKSSMM